MSTCENVYVINLKNRPDRWEFIQNEMAKTKCLTPIRWEATVAHPGSNGCALSHLSIIEMAKDSAMPYIIVWEDDTQIRNPHFDLIFTRIMAYLKSHSTWDVFNGNPANIGHITTQTVKVVYPYPAMISYEFCTSTNFMIYHQRSYDKILECRKLYHGRSGPPIDMELNNHDLRFVTSIPYLTHQKDDYSDITKRLAKYDIYILTRGEDVIREKVKNSYVGGKLIGGLGNQMFTMAAAFCEAYQQKTLLCLEKKNHIPCKERTTNEYWDSYFNFLHFCIPFVGYDKTIAEKQEFTIQTIPPFDGRLQLTGYFQHVGWFHGMRNELRQLFTMDHSTRHYLESKYPWINGDTLKVAIHIRRGDYVKLKHFHHNVPISYYEKCIQLISDKHPNNDIKWLIFSDDIGWCKSNLPNNDQHSYTYIEGDKDFVELCLMSLCHIFIIANSTFSWWGAYLANPPAGDEVYVPHKWLETGKYPHGLILPDWHKIAY